MATKQDAIVEIKKSIEDKKLIIGTERTIKGLKSGSIRKIFKSSNCPDGVAKDLERYAKLAGAEITELDFPNVELGVICKKQFSISVVSIST